MNRGGWTGRIGRRQKPHGHYNDGDQYQGTGEDRFTALARCAHCPVHRALSLSLSMAIALTWPSTNIVLAKL